MSTRGPIVVNESVDRPEAKPKGNGQVDDGTSANTTSVAGFRASR